MMVELKPRELMGHPNVKPRAIMIQAPHGEGAETILKGSTSKRMEARGIVEIVKKYLTIGDYDIVHSVGKLTAEGKMKCKACGIEKELGEYPVCGIKKNGDNYYRKICKKCYCEGVKEWNKNNNDKHNKNARVSYSNHKEEIIEKVKRYQKSYPQKANAKNKIFRAVRSGVIVKKESCEICGKKCKARGHHPDYKDPLRVIWVCNSCHRNIHLALGQSVAKVGE